MILSPAKTLDLSPCDFEATTTTCPDCDVAKTKQVIEAMKKRKEVELGKLLGVSANLAKTAHGVSSVVSDGVSSLFLLGYSVTKHLHL